MTTICCRCHRTLARPPVHLGGMAFGPRCAAAVAGPKPRRRSLLDRLPPAPDPRQADLFKEQQP